MKRLLPPTLVLILLSLMTVLAILTPIVGWAWPWRLVGVIPLLAGIALAVRGSNLFARVATNIKTFDDPDRLVESGPFRWTRNPMYLGFVMLLVGAAVLFGEVTAFFGPVVFTIAADRWYIPFEERRLVATFGATYERYRERVPRWLGPVRSVRAAG